MRRQSYNDRERVQLGIKIQVDAIAIAKCWQYVDLAKGEISMLGLVDAICDESSGAIASLIVRDFFLVKQTCSSDETTMDPAAVAELLVALESQGIDSGMLRCWCHSHGDLSVFWSGQDDRCIEGLANGEWLLSLVVNKQRDSMMRLDQYHPCHLYLGDVVWDVLYNTPDGLSEACFFEFKSKVSESHAPFRTRKQRTAGSIEDLKLAQDRGVISAEELEDEVDFLGLNDEYDVFQPF